jgi:hypothetical protein
MKMFERLGTLGVIPGIGEQNAADIPEKSANRGQGTSPLKNALKSLDEISDLSAGAMFVRRDKPA